MTGMLGWNEKPRVAMSDLILRRQLVVDKGNRLARMVFGRGCKEWSGFSMARIGREEKCSEIECWSVI